MTPQYVPKMMRSEMRGTLKHKACEEKQTWAFKERKIIG